MKHLGRNTVTTSWRSKSSKSTRGINHTKNFDYSSVSSLHDEDERKARDFADRFLVAACKAGYTSWDSDPVRMANFLKEINEQHGFNVSINMNHIKKGLNVLDKRIKKKSTLYESYNNNPSKKTDIESPSASTSYSPGTQTPDNVDVGDEMNVEMNVCREAPLFVMVTGLEKSDSDNYQRRLSMPCNQAKNVEDRATQDIVNGREAGMFVIQRVLNPSDIDDYQCRLSMPCNQVRNIDDFLTREEAMKLSEKLGVPAKVIDSSNRIYDTYLRKVKAGPKTHSYVIGKPWNRIKMDNGFRAGMTVEVRVSRGDGGALCIILERVG